eukprot:13784993-Heterocapsa_arctica.AAC.1
MYAWVIPAASHAARPAGPRQSTNAQLRPRSHRCEAAHLRQRHVPSRPPAGTGDLPGWGSAAGGRAGNTSASEVSPSCSLSLLTCSARIGGYPLNST